MVTLICLFFVPNHAPCLLPSRLFIFCASGIDLFLFSVPDPFYVKGGECVVMCFLCLPCCFCVVSSNLSVLFSCLSASLSVCLSLCLSASLSISLPLSLSLCLSAWCLSLCLCEVVHADFRCRPASLLLSLIICSFLSFCLLVSVCCTLSFCLLCAHSIFLLDPPLSALLCNVPLTLLVLGMRLISVLSVYHVFLLSPTFLHARRHTICYADMPCLPVCILSVRLCHSSPFSLCCPPVCTPTCWYDCTTPLAYGSFHDLVVWSDTLRAHNEILPPACSFACPFCFLVCLPRLPTSLSVSQLPACLHLLVYPPICQSVYLPTGLT